MVMGYKVDTFDRFAYAIVLAVERAEGRAEGIAKARAERQARLLTEEGARTLNKDGIMGDADIDAMKEDDETDLK